MPLAEPIEISYDMTAKRARAIWWQKLGKSTVVAALIVTLLIYFAMVSTGVTRGFLLGCVYLLGASVIAVLVSLYKTHKFYPSPVPTTLVFTNEGLRGVAEGNATAADWGCYAPGRFHAKYWILSQRRTGFTAMISKADFSAAQQSEIEALLKEKGLMPLVPAAA
jgi:hypothetical protein